MPAFIYAVLNDDEDDVTFAISRVPHRNVAPALGNMAKSGSAVATTQGSFFCLDSSVNVDDYDTNPCIALGSISMTKDAADAWTILSFSNFTGLGRFTEGGFYTYPANQNGATSSCLSSTNPADTLPTFASVGRGYSINRLGWCVVNWGFNNTNTSGSGTGDIKVHLPFNFVGNYFLGNYNDRTNSGGLTYNSYAIRSNTSNVNYVNLFPTGSGQDLLQPGHFVAPNITNSGLMVMNYQVGIG
jgi:hypothetical protein